MCRLGKEDVTQVFTRVTGVHLTWGKFFFISIVFSGVSASALPKIFLNVSSSAKEENTI